MKVPTCFQVHLQYIVGGWDFIVAGSGVIAPRLVLGPDTSVSTANKKEGVYVNYEFVARRHGAFLKILNRLTNYHHNLIYS